MNIPDFIKIKRYWETNGKYEVTNIYEHGIIRFTLTRDSDEIIHHLYSEKWEHK